MKCNHAVILSIIASILLAMKCFAVPAVDVETAKADAYRRMAQAQTAADSIAPLYDLYDLSTRAERSQIGFRLHDTAAHVGDYDTQLDMLRQLTVFHGSSDSMLHLINKMILQVPESNDRSETLTFNNIYINCLDACSNSEQERIEDLRRALREYSEYTSDDLYGSIERLFTLCRLISGETSGELLTEYYTKLSKLIAQLPQSKSNALRNQFYTYSAIAYTDNGNPEQAVASDRKLLEIIEELKKEYAERGRRYRNYHTSEYVAYRRLLSNYKALTSQEVEQYHNRVMQLCSEDPDIAADFNLNRRADIYYYMATGRYDMALPLMQQMLPGATSLKYRIYLIRAIIEAAEATGHNDMAASVALEYSKLLEQYIDNKAAESYRELQVIYDTQELRNANTRMALEQAHTEQIRSRMIIIISLVSIIVLLGVILWGMRLYRRSRRLAASLTQTNADLRAERDKQRHAQQAVMAARDEAREAVRQKNSFVNNISHEALAPMRAIAEYSLLIADSVDESKRPYLGKFADSITHNVEMLQNLINQILELGSSDDSKLSVERASVSVRAICDSAIATVSHDEHPGVELVYEPDKLPGLVFNTDGKRVEQVLVNLLENAFKFTKSGTVTLTAFTNNVDDKRPCITFAVTDTGIGIPLDKREAAFDRFEKLGRTSPGIGLGLTLARQIAHLLGGFVIIDPDYTGPGTRLLFTLPC